MKQFYHELSILLGHFVTRTKGWLYLVTLLYEYKENHHLSSAALSAVDLIRDSPYRSSIPVICGSLHQEETGYCIRYRTLRESIRIKTPPSANFGPAVIECQDQSGQALSRSPPELSFTVPSVNTTILSDVPKTCESKIIKVN